MKQNVDGSQSPTIEPRRSERLARLQQERAAAAAATAQHLSSLDEGIHSKHERGNTSEPDRDAGGSKAGAQASEHKSGADASTGRPSAGLGSHVARSAHSDTQDKSDSSWQALSEPDRKAAAAGARDEQKFAIFSIFSLFSIFSIFSIFSLFSIFSIFLIFSLFSIFSIFSIF